MSAFWDDHATRIDPDRFRADTQYLGCQAEYPYEAMLKDVRHTEATPPWRGVLGLLTEDGAFGCTTKVVDGVTVSRDLLDSCVELAFLERHLPDHLVGVTRVLDIGAGYGRLAHRWQTAYPQVDYRCVDPVSASRLVCAKYLRHRGLESRVYSPAELDELPTPDLAVNVHSWPECTREEIRWWLRWLREREVPRLFVVPHDPEVLCADDGQPFLSDIAWHGYTLAEHWYGPACWPRTFLLYERTT